MDINAAHAAYTLHPDADSLTALFHALRSYANAIALSYHAPDAENAASEAVARAWTHLDSFQPRPGATFKSWFRRIVLRELQDRHAEEIPTLPLSDWTESAPTYAHGQIPDDLTAEQVAVVKILIVTGDFQSTAEQLGITRKALERRVAKIKKKCLR
jgi:DNA-directed RNA polymerase specialized sigma24 family protein